MENRKWKIVLIIPMLIGISIVNCFAQDTTSVVPISNIKQDTIMVPPPTTTTSKDTIAVPHPTTISKDTTAVSPTTTTSKDTTAISPPTTISKDTTAIPPTTKDTTVIPPTTKDTTVIPPTTKDTTTIPPTTKDTIPLPIITASFDTTELILIEGEIVSKILRIKNNSDKEQSFRLNINYPGGWKILTDLSKHYTFKSGDSIFIPIRIIPLGKIKGNTKYLINVYVIADNNNPMAMAYFYSTRPKYVNWDITISPFDKVYLMNDSTSAKFDANILNIGNEEQEMFMHISNYRKDILLSDNTGRVVKNPYREFTLRPQSDTSFHYCANIMQGMRNFRTVDDVTYCPGFLNEAKRYTLFLKTSEARILGTQGIQKMKKIDFVRLPNEMKVNPNNSFSIPLVMEANISNLLNAQPILNLLFSGITTLNNGATINYFSQFFFSLYYADIDFLKNSTQYIGYFDNKWQVQIGSVGGLGGAPSSGGKGANVMYQFRPNQSAGVFYNRAPYFFGKADRQSVGAVHTFSASRYRIMSSYSHMSSSGRTSYNSDYFGSSGSYSIANGHTAGLGMYVVKNASNDPSNSFSRWGYQVNANYSGNYLQGRLQSGVGCNYLSSFYSPFDKGDKITATHNSGFRLNDKLNLSLNNNYIRNIYEPISIAATRQKLRSINNTFSANHKIGEGFAGSGIFYNMIKNNDTTVIHSRGITTNYSQAKYDNNTFFTISMMSGYSRILSDPHSRNYFFFQYFSLFRYHTFSATLRYSYGTVSVADRYFLEQGVYYQFLGASINYQYQFHNSRFVLNNYISYAYYNQFKRHSIGYTPELLYFSKTGWKIRVMGGYYFSSSRANRGAIAIPGQSGEIPAPENVHSSTAMLQVGVRKEFNIPYPWGKKKYFSHTYIAFIDLNGNNKWDNNELLLDNVVIRTGDCEILTNEKGKARLLNVLPGRYNFSAFSLLELKGYFANIEDSISVIINDTIPVPFVKGVKVYGNVFVDREKFSPDAQIPIDLSGIRISASGIKNHSTLTSKDGTFDIYVPYGKYAVMMDEKILNDQFILLQNNIEIILDKKVESLFVTFLISEKKRKVNIKKFGSKSGTDTTRSNTSGAINQNKQNIDSTLSKIQVAMDTIYSAGPPPPGAIPVPGHPNLYYYTLPVGPGITYRIQLTTTSNRITPSQRAIQFKGIPNIMEYTEGGYYKYTSGNFNSIDKVKKQKTILRTKKYKDAFIVPFKNNKRIRYK
ncbi:MAG: hypothetical protein V1781_06255 [Bacteroidota bacterium]